MPLPNSSGIASRSADQGGVGKPGGFTNTYCLTGRGGLLFYPRGLTTELMWELD
jgi:hypothetical protein